MWDPHAIVLVLNIRVAYYNFHYVYLHTSGDFLSRLSSSPNFIDRKRSNFNVRSWTFSICFCFIEEQTHNDAQLSYFFSRNMLKGKQKSLTKSKQYAVFFIPTFLGMKQNFFKLLALFYTLTSLHQ